MFYRKKPVVVEARELTKENVNEIAEWCGGDATSENVLNGVGRNGLAMVIYTLEGAMIAREGDFIIKGVAGEFYPCRSDIFQDTYEDISFSEDDYDPAEECDDRRTYINVDDMVNHEDGSATIGISMDQNSMKLFAEIGILKVLTDESKRIIANNDEFDTNVGC
jgi:hypothetical protein